MTALTAGHNNRPGRTQFRGHTFRGQNTFRNFGDNEFRGISGTRGISREFQAGISGTQY